MRPDATTDDTRTAPACSSCSRVSWRPVTFLVLTAAVVTAVALWAARARADDQEGAADSCALFDQEHTAWTSLLRRYVRDGVVDYAGWKRSGQEDLDAYLGSLESVCRGHYDTWSRPQKLAFWINAYNAYTVRLVLNHYPLRSIRDIGLLPDAPFREDFIPIRKLRGDTISLNDIEHEILRKELQEPRIHFAIVCASKSCPALRSEAYRADQLEHQLDDAARVFVRDATKNRFDVSARTLWLSSILDWFHDDFERAARSVSAYVARYADESTARAIRAGDVRVKHLDYDWSLNGR
jgi:hypothetical protein